MGFRIWGHIGLRGPNVGPVWLEWPSWVGGAEEEEPDFGEPTEDALGAAELLDDDAGRFGYGGGSIDGVQSR